MRAYEISQLILGAQMAKRSYLEFLRVPNLSMGLYRLKAGEEDSQQPHKQDEVYYVLEGTPKSS